MRVRLALLPIAPSFLEVVLIRQRVKLIKGYPWFAARSVLAEFGNSRTRSKP